MRGKSLRRVVLLVIAVSLILLTTAYALTITDLKTSPGQSGSEGAINNRGQKPSFISNGLLVKLTPQARANLRVTGEDVNPTATGLPSLDVIFHLIWSRRSGARWRKGLSDRTWNTDPPDPVESWRRARQHEDDSRKQERVGKV